MKKEDLIKEIKAYIHWAKRNPIENARLTYVEEGNYHSELLGFAKWLEKSQEGQHHE